MGLNDRVERINQKGEVFLQKRGVLRKTRKDKKQEIKATIDFDLKDSIYRLSYITDTPVKDVCEKLCAYVMREKEMIDYLTSHFQRTIMINSTFYMGSRENKAIPKRLEGETSRVTIKFKQAEHDFIYSLSYGLELSKSRTVAVLLDLAVHDIAIVNQYIKNYLKKELNDNQMFELKQLLRYINEQNQTHLSWSALLSFIKDEVTSELGAPVVKTYEAIRRFLESEKFR